MWIMDRQIFSTSGRAEWKLYISDTQDQNSYWAAGKRNRGGVLYFVFIEDKYTSGVKLSLWFTEERAIFFWEIINFVDNI